MKYYFAYGSNLSHTQMSKRCPDSQKLGLAVLPGYRWIISERGYATVVESVEDSVKGVLFLISGSDERALDRYEGVTWGLYDKHCLEVNFEGSKVKAMVYIEPFSGEGQPRDEYVHRINLGVQEADLNLEYVRKYIRMFVAEE